MGIGAIAYRQHLRGRLLRGWKPQLCTGVDARHMLHFGERSSDLNTLPMASCRQCQAWDLDFGGLLLALSVGLLAVACRRRLSDEPALEPFRFRLSRGGSSASLSDAFSSPASNSPGSAFALASCQRRPEILLVSGPAGGISDGCGCAAGVASPSARMSGSRSRSDFAASFGISANSVLLWPCTASTVGDVAILIAIAGARPTRQKRLIHIVLVIFD